MGQLVDKCVDEFRRLPCGEIRNNPEVLLNMNIGLLICNKFLSTSRPNNQVVRAYRSRKALPAPFTFSVYFDHDLSWGGTFVCANERPASQSFLQTVHMGGEDNGQFILAPERLVHSESM